MADPRRLLTWIVCLSLPYILYKSRIAYLRFVFKRKHGCKPAPGLPRIDPFFGLDLALQNLRAIRQQNRNVTLQSQLEEYGYTFETRLYQTTRFFTIEPKNLQSIFSTDFVSWGLQPLRMFVFEPFIGKGIMVMDG